MYATVVAKALALSDASRVIEGCSMQTNQEQATLKFSISLTIFLGVLGVASGLGTGIDCARSTGHRV